MKILDYHILKTIRQGSHAEISKCRTKKTREYIVFRRFPKAWRRRVLSEVQIIRIIAEKTQDRYLLPIKSFHETKNHYWIAQPFLFGVSLDVILKDDKTIQNDLFIFIISKIRKFMRILHENSIFMNVLPLTSIMFSTDGDLNICDIGDALCMEKETPVAYCKYLIETYPSLVAPEFINDDAKPDISSDFYAFGVFIYQLYFGEVPVLENLDLNSSFISCSAMLEDLLQTLLNIDRTKRKDWKWLGNHPIFNEVLDLSVEIPSVVQNCLPIITPRLFGAAPVQTDTPAPMLKVFEANSPPIVAKDNENVSSGGTSGKLSSTNKNHQKTESDLSDIEEQSKILNAQVSTLRGPSATILSNTSSDNEIDEDIGSIPEESKAINETNVDRHSTMKVRKFEEITKSKLPDGTVATWVSLTGLLVDPVSKPSKIVATHQKRSRPMYINMGFKPLSIPELQSLSNTQLEVFLTQIYNVLCDPKRITRKHLQNILSYLITAVCVGKVASFISSSELLLYLFDLLPFHEYLSHNERLCPITLNSHGNIARTSLEIIAIIFRNSVSITIDANLLIYIEQLLSISQSGQMSFRKLALIALGELLFYLACTDDLTELFLDQMLIKIQPLLKLSVDSNAVYGELASHIIANLLTKTRFMKLISSNYVLSVIHNLKMNVIHSNRQIAFIFQVLLRSLLLGNEEIDFEFSFFLEKINLNELDFKILLDIIGTLSLISSSKIFAKNYIYSLIQIILSNIYDIASVDLAQITLFITIVFHIYPDVLTILLDGSMKSLFDTLANKNDIAIVDDSFNLLISNLKNILSSTIDDVSLLSKEIQFQLVSPPYIFKIFDKQILDKIMLNFSKSFEEKNFETFENFLNFVSIFVDNFNILMQFSYEFIPTLPLNLCNIIVNFDTVDNANVDVINVRFICLKLLCNVFEIYLAKSTYSPFEDTMTTNLSTTHTTLGLNQTIMFILSNSYDILKNESTVQIVQYFLKLLSIITFHSPLAKHFFAKDPLGHNCLHLSIAFLDDSDNNNIHNLRFLQSVISFMGSEDEIIDLIEGSNIVPFINKIFRTTNEFIVDNNIRTFLLPSLAIINCLLSIDSPKLGCLLEFESDYVHCSKFINDLDESPEYYDMDEFKTFQMNISNSVEEILQKIHSKQIV
eukprot:TRINITY_DN1839_c0_g2_i1.p1 TRINITY_DN1839_c0_g2~~TRINITY_DN1839_c0_g2_i1.p1  ORF type:complete len:1150 (+),score=272.98 TRINITY_DN1839_c0_g2_i1:71-3520(+)